MSRLSFVFSWPALAVGLLFLLAAAWLSRQQYRRSGGRRLVLWLELLRWSLVLLLFLTLLQPEWRQLIKPRTPPEVVVLCDRSASMQTRDVTTSAGTISRATWLDEQCATQFWQPLQARYTVQVEDFAVPPTDTAPEEEEGTDLNAALDSVMTGRRNLRAVVLLSDGDWNLGSSPMTAATRLQANGVSVFAIGVGNDKYLPDLELKNVAVPGYGLVGEQVIIPFTVRSHLDREVRTRIQLLADGGEVTTKELVIPAHGQVQETVLWLPQRDGPASLTLKLPTEDDELRDDNNLHDFMINVRTEILKVLVIDSLPRWEYRFLRNALSRDPAVQVKTILFNQEVQVGGRDYLDQFPETKDKLSQFDVVFLGDVGIGEEELTREQAELLKGLVEQQGSGLVFIPGRRGRQATLLDTGLSEIYPVTMDPSKPDGYSSATPVALNLTRLGSGHRLTMLANNEATNMLVWQTLPGFCWCAGVERARAGSEVLGVHSAQDNQWGQVPLLVTRPAGNGKTLFLGTDSAWRWRRGVEDLYHYRFWGQVVRWMSYQRHRAHNDGFRLAFAPDSPVPGDAIFFTATVFDTSGLPLNDATVVAEVTTPKGRSSRQTLNQLPGDWGVYQGQFVAEHRGKYSITLSCEKTGSKMTTELSVHGLVREQVGHPARTDVLKEIATLTRGQYGQTAELASFIDALAARPDPAPVEKRLRLWAHPAWGGFLLILLTVYWVGRKYGGLI